MTLQEAIDRARRMEAAAAAGWKRGWKPAVVAREAAACLREFEAASTTPEKAREIVAALKAEEAVLL